jgi:hypothetical protein
MKSSLTQPALIGGLVGGVLSALPLIYVGNLCCCLWIVSGGAVAAYLLQQNQSLPITTGEGALVGLLAGVAGAFVYLVLSIPINILMAPMERALLERLSETMSNMPPEFREFARNPGSGSIGVRLVLGFLGFVLMLVLSAIFSTLGGMLGAVIFRKKMPPGTVDLPTSS